MRLYGLDYKRSRAKLDPKELVENFFRDGMHLDDNFIRSHTPEKVEWVTGSSIVRPYILLTFHSVRGKKVVQRRRANIDFNYRPHGKEILIRDDLSPEEELCFLEAQRRCEALQNKGFAVMQSDLRIRVGIPPNLKWYKYDAPEIWKMLDDLPVASRPT